MQPAYDGKVQAACRLYASLVGSRLYVTLASGSGRIAEKFDTGADSETVGRESMVVWDGTPARFRLSPWWDRGSG